MNNEIIAFEKSGGLPRIIKKNGDIIYTTNLISSLVDTSITKTNKFYVYYTGTSWNSRQNRLGTSSLVPTFADITTPGAIGNASKFMYNSITSKYFIGTSDYYLGSGSVNNITTAGRNAINTNNENYAHSLISGPSNGSGQGITFSTSTNIYTFSTPIQKTYFISYHFYLPYASLTANSEGIFRIRQTNITGPILGEMRYFNTSSSNNYYCCNLGIITNNPSTICTTFQLTSGTFAISSLQATIKVVIFQI